MEWYKKYKCYYCGRIIGAPVAHRCCGGVLRKRKLMFKEIDMARETNGQIGGDHYKKCGIEPVEYIHANGLDFNEGSIVKYITRHRRKNGVEDIQKIKDFCDIILELDYGIKRPKKENTTLVPESPYVTKEDLLKKGLTSRQANSILEEDVVKGTCPC